MSSASGPRAKCDQVIFEAMAKAAEIIVHARSPSPHSQSMSARFNLQVPEIAEIRQSLQHHRQSLHLPLRLEVYDRNHVLVERWSLEYLQQSQSQQPLSGDPIVQLRQVCKKLVIWLRTLYCWTRMLPSFSIRGTALQYRLEVLCVDEGLNTVPQFSYTSSKEVPTPYGLLLWKVWYAAHVQKPTTMPIPIASQSRTTTTTNSIPIASSQVTNNNVAKSAPTRDNYLLQQQNAHAQHGRSFDRTGLLKKTHSNVEDHSEEREERHRLDERTHARSHSTHRAALHDPPTYAYNTTTPMRQQQHHPLLRSSSPLAGTPPTTPAFLSSTPPTLGFLFPPAAMRNTIHATPPFSNLPRQLSKPEELCALQQQQQQQQSEVHPTSLDLLHSSPFKTNASAFSSLLGEQSEWMRNSSMPAYHDDDDDDDDEEDMPFAVEVEPPDASMASFAQKSVHKLTLLETESSQEMSALSMQLQEFKSFGAGLDQ